VSGSSAPRQAGDPRGLLWPVLGLAVGVRLAAVQALIGFHTPAALEPASDSRIHIALVYSLLTGHGFSLFGAPTGETPPLYIVLLAGLYRLSHDPAAVRVFQALLGAVDCALLYAIGRRLFDPVTALVSALLLAVYPLAVYLAGLHLTENLFLPLLLLVVLQSIRLADRPTPPAAGLLGGLIGLGALTRAGFLAFLPFVLLWAVAVWGIRSGTTYRTTAFVVAAAAVVLLPWMIRNAVVLHTFAPVQDNGGLMFWAGNNAAADGGIVWPTRRTWTATRPPDTRLWGWTDLTSGQANRLYVREALAWIGGHPRAYLRLLGLKLGRLYGLTKSQDREALRVPRAVAILHYALLAAAAAGLALTRRRWRRYAILIALIVFTNVVVLLFSGSTRYELPMLPSVLLFSGAALSALWYRLVRTSAPASVLAAPTREVSLR
jgi:4-amino-4-deoxy-L-arabinose transferase-like glycosyltransferase